MNSTTANVSPLWAVTCLFNPLRSRRRAANFRTFRAHLGVPLIAVELSFDGRFELREGEAEVLVQLTGGDVMWQKERLLNVGLRHLPPACEQVALIDCDVLFEDDDWAAAAADVLTRHPVAQLFSSVQYLPRDWTPGTGAAPVDLMRHQGVASSIIVDGLTADACLGPQPDGERGAFAPGFAWACRRELLDRYMLFDCNIAGGGDTAMACASWGVFEAVERRHAMTPAHRGRYRAWAEPWFDAVRGQVGMLDGGLLHLWHGELEHRMGGTRHRRLAEHDYDPHRDIELSDSGCWRWTSDKPGLHRFLADYFAARREDG